MNTPYSVDKKVMKKGKETTSTEWVCNADKKKKFMKGFNLKTEEEFIKKIMNDPNMMKLVDIEIPQRFTWIWFQFLDIWRTCQRDFNGNVILTPRQILDYAECFKVNFSTYEKHLIFRMKTWAEDTIYSLREKDK